MEVHAAFAEGRGSAVSSPAKSAIDRNEVSNFLIEVTARRFMRQSN